jgi:uncharacterized protein (TIGR02452 family)
LIARKRAAELGRETMQILEAGHYRTDTEKFVEIGELVRNAVDDTRSYPPDQPIPDVQPGTQLTRIEVENETTLMAARRLNAMGLRVAALNFASAKNPGGGFLGGARAQEESLARSSGLYACLADQPMYAFHRARRDPMYTDYAIYSPDVPVFRTDDGTLLEQPYICSFITCPAVNAKVVLQRDPSRGPEIRAAMKQRIAKILTIAALHNHDTLVLGAWGCGVFGNDSQEIAELFNEALSDRFRGVFARVMFAIVDRSKNARFIGPFYNVFTSGPTGSGV